MDSSLQGLELEGQWASQEAPSQGKVLPVTACFLSPMMLSTRVVPDATAAGSSPGDTASSGLLGSEHPLASRAHGDGDRAEWDKHHIYSVPGILCKPSREPSTASR